MAEQPWDGRLGPHEYMSGQTFTTLTVRYEVPLDITPRDLLADLGDLLGLGAGGGCFGGFPGEGLSGGSSGGQRPEGALGDLHCLCACLMDLATDPRKSRAAALALPLDATLGELGLGPGTALTPLPKAMLLRTVE